MLIEKCISYMYKRSLKITKKNLMKGGDSYTALKSFLDLDHAILTDF